MSVLEFIAALKWPATVLILAFAASRWWHASPDASTTFRNWIDRRNIRVSVAGQQLEATLADTARSLIAATGSDDELAEAEPTNEAESGADRTEVGVAVRRREAVETLLRNAATLGWEAADGGYPMPALTVTWNSEGEPHIELAPFHLNVNSSPWFSASTHSVPASEYRILGNSPRWVLLSNGSRIPVVPDHQADDPGNTV